MHAEGTPLRRGVQPWPIRMWGTPLASFIVPPGLMVTGKGVTLYARFGPVSSPLLAGSTTDAIGESDGRA